MPNAKEQLAITKAIWNENDKEIRAELYKSDKVRSTVIPKFQKERNYLKRMNLPYAQIWFRLRCKITNNIKGNTSSTFKDNMQCIHCTSREDETQKQLEKCESTKIMRKKLNIDKEREHQTWK